MDAAAVHQADKHLKEVLLALAERLETNTAETVSTAAAAADASAGSGQPQLLSASQVRLWLLITGSSIQALARRSRGPDGPGSSAAWQDEALAQLLACHKPYLGDLAG